MNRISTALFWIAVRAKGKIKVCNIAKIERETSPQFGERDSGIYKDTEKSIITYFKFNVLSLLSVLVIGCWTQSNISKKIFSRMVRIIYILILQP